MRRKQIAIKRNLINKLYRNIIVSIDNLKSVRFSNFVLKIDIGTNLLYNYIVFNVGGGVLYYKLPLYNIYVVISL